jgi:ribosomal protein L16 Arg81 hydroxylase
MTMIVEKFNGQLDSYELTDKPMVIQGAFKDFTMPTWDEIINHFNKCAQNGDRYGLKTAADGSFGAACNKGNEIESVRALVDECWLFRPDEPKCTAHLYISFLENSSTYGWHADTTDVFFIQGIGVSVWEVKVNGEVFESPELNPGDLIYVPANMEHNPQPLTPRVGISIGFADFGDD